MLVPSSLSEAGDGTIFGAIMAFKAVVESGTMNDWWWCGRTWNVIKPLERAAGMRDDPPLVTERRLTTAASPKDNDTAAVATSTSMVR